MTVSRSFVRCGAMIALHLSLFSAAQAASIFAGSDYLSTTSASFNFGGSIGTVAFQGAFGAGVADTVVTRLEDAILPAVGSSDTISIQMRLLELRSIAPILMGGNLFNVAVSLNPALPSLGTMTINHQLPDNATPAPEGTFTSSLQVNFVMSFVPVGPGSAPNVVGSLNLSQTTPANWTHNPDPTWLLVNGPPGDLNANCHNPPNCLTPANNPGILFHDFFPIIVNEEHPGVGIHQAAPALFICPGCPNVPPLQAIVPEPGTYALIVSGIGLLVVRRRWMN
jgi:hypothetical protein